MRILYDSKKPEHKTPFGVLTPKVVCVLRIRIPKDLQTKFAQLVVEREDGHICREFAFAWAGSPDKDYDEFKCDFQLEHHGLYFYWFRITAKTGTFRLYRAGDGTNMEAGDKWQLSVVPEEFTVPREMQGRVMYQIFPDRFCKVGQCDLTGKLDPYILREDWGGQPEWRPSENGEILCNDFFGGNFRGIISKLDYLKSLGVGTIYLNPVCYGYSNHRYDTACYKLPDPMLGTETEFAQLCHEAHDREIKIILDGVFSHTGADSMYFDRRHRFQDGACDRPDSPYRSWYTFKEYPYVYDCWWNFPTLPNVNELAPGFLDYVIDSEDSVVAHWLRLGADGIRLDVADELPDEFILRLKRRLRALNPDAVLYGEVWEDASNKSAYGRRRRYFTDGELDGIMNYPWQKAILRFARGEDDGSALGETLMTIAENYPTQVLHTNMNFLGTHDTPRALTALAGDFDGDRAYQAGVVLTPEQRALGMERLKLAAFLSFTLPGCPCIYYGDEAGMEGCKDPFNRGCFPWGKEDLGLTDYYRGLAALKNGSEVLRYGDLYVTKAGEGRIAFTRTCNGRTLTCCVNNGPEPWAHPAARLRYAQRTILEDGNAILAPGGYCVLER